jgi:hypothetical protein
MRKSIVAAVTAVLFTSFVPAVFAARVVPVGDFRFLGGQYFYNNTPSSLSGNLSFTVVPAVKFSDKFALIPTYMGSYRGTKEVSDLAGGGTLFQDGQDHFVSVKGIYSPAAPLKLKLGASYRMELLRETKDENWGKGLFDYHKLNTGIEAEYAFTKKTALRVGADYYTLRFPNYASLESSVTSGELGRELAGKNTLDCNNTMASVRLNNAFGPVKTELGGSITSKDYTDQRLVTASGDLSAEKRKDAYSLANANIACPIAITKGFGLIPSLDLQYILNDSTQGHYDANKYLYISDYYDYTSLAVSPLLHFVLGALPWTVSVGGSYCRQTYANRPVQDEAGNYQLNDKIYVDEMMFSVAVSYPLTKEFKLRAVSNFIDSRSNMKYEKTFAYNYQTSNYLFGFSYEF